MERVTGDGPAAGTRREGTRMATEPITLDRALRRMAVLHAREMAALRRAGARPVLRQRPPNTALPMRTTVAPWAIASSRSPLMPIDRPTAFAVPGAPLASTSSRSDRSRS